VERDGEGERDPGGHADRVWAHRRVEGQTRGRHLLGRRIGAVRKARGAKAPAEGRHLARGVGVDSRVDRQAQTDPAQGPGRLLDRHRARAVWPGLSPQEDPPPRHPRAEGLGRSAAAKAHGRGRPARAHALVAGERNRRAARAFIEFLLTERGQKVFMERGLFPITPKYKVQGPPGSTAEMAVEFTGGVRSYFDRELSNVYDEAIAAKRSEALKAK